MKKLLALLLAALMVLSLAACSMEGGSSEPAKTEETTAAPETTETETEQPAEETAAPEVKADADITIAVVPKSLDNAIFLDSQAAAEAKAKELGINTVYSELLPGDKVSKVEELLDQKHTGKLAFVGDGINDAPVLSRADIGIAMGAMGSDAAIEAADVVLMDDDPMKIAKAIRISRKCLRIVHENIVFAIGIKLLCLLLGALGIANMWAAIFADVGVMVLAVLNAIRALMVKNL